MSNSIEKIHDVIFSHNFVVTLGGYLCGFSSITNIENAVEYESIQEGGVNDHVHTWVKPTSQQHRLIFEKGTGRYNMWDVGERNLLLGRTFLSGGTILLINRAKGEKRGSMSGSKNDLIPGGSQHMSSVLRKYSFNNPMIVRWEVSGLNASDAQIMIDRMEVVHDGLYLDEL